jgi:hypothetical protein
VPIILELIASPMSLVGTRRAGSISICRHAEAKMTALLERIPLLRLAAIRLLNGTKSTLAMFPERNLVWTVS